MKYRVLKDNFLWKKNAILGKTYGGDGYVAVDGLFSQPGTGNEWISAHIVENCPEWFEPIKETVWEKFVGKISQEKYDLVIKMRNEWRK